MEGPWQAVEKIRFGLGLGLVGNGGPGIAGAGAGSQEEPANDHQRTAGRSSGSEGGVSGESESIQSAGETDDTQAKADSGGL